MRDARAYRLGKSHPDLAPVIEGFDGRLAALEAKDYALATPDWSVGPAAAEVVVGFALRDLNGKRVAAEVFVEAYVSETQRAIWSPLGSGWATIQGTVLDFPVLNAWWRLLTNADGKAALQLDNGGAGVFYLHVLWLGRLFVSPAITFT